MDEDFSQFIEDFNREVKSRAHSNDYEVEEAFTEVFGDILVEYGEIDDYQPASWLDKNIGARVDAYHFDDDMETVNLVINLWKDWNGDDILSLHMSLGLRALFPTILGSSPCSIHR